MAVTDTEGEEEVGVIEAEGTSFEQFLFKENRSLSQPGHDKL